jgi:hypothetical protein
VLYGLGYSGNGVVQSHLGGRILSSLLLGERNAWTDSGLVRGPLATARTAALVRRHAGAQCHSAWNRPKTGTANRAGWTPDWPPARAWQAKPTTPGHQPHGLKRHPAAECPICELSCLASWPRLATRLAGGKPLQQKGTPTPRPKWKNAPGTLPGHRPAGLYQAAGSRCPC